MIKYGYGINPLLLALTFSVYNLAAGLALRRIPQHSQNKSEVERKKKD
ncbi:MAG: hypothetical protein ACRD8Z_28405 [Nitrososphaeraceae archaeon]